MCPFLDLGFVKIPMYGLCIVVGGLLGTLLVFFLCKKTKKVFWDFVITAAIAIGLGFVFSKLFFLFITYPIKEIPSLLVKMFTESNSEVLTGGFVFYGGIFGGAIGYLIGVKIAKCKFSDFLDIYTFVIAFVHAFGRVGCFCAGCCYGIHYNGPFSLHYRNPISTVEPNIGIFPVQLLEASLLLIFSIIIFIMIFKGKKVSILYYTGFYSIVRFCLEYLRGDVERGKLWLFSTSQWISIILFVITIVCIVVLRIRRKKVKEDIPA